jgi:hypothetical protein
MTERKHLKTRVRARMTETGERYAAARAHVVRGAEAAATGATTTAPSTADAPGPTPGINPGTAALTALLAHAGLTIPESLALVIGGGVGMGVFQFHYAKEGVSTLFIAGRHRWDDDRAFLERALRRLGIEPVVTESTSARTAAGRLRDALAAGGPVVAWVDAAELGTRALPPIFSGGAYHVVVVRGIDDERGIATIDDLAARRFEIPLDVLARARARIGRQRNRVMYLPPGATIADRALPAAIRDGLLATIDGLDHPRSRQFGLAALVDWQRRLRDGGRDGWSTVFPAGERLWTALAAIDEYVEHYGSGGGLMRPMFAAGLRRASAILGDGRLADLGTRYDALGRAWTDLADAALHDGVPAFRRTRAATDRRAEAFRDGGPEAADALRAAWAEADAVRAEVADCFPLEAPQTAALLEVLAGRLGDLHAGEVDALDGLRAATV